MSDNGKYYLANTLAYYIAVLTTNLIQATEAYKSGAQMRILALVDSEWHRQTR